jgi:hypothetical protein
MAGMTKDAPLSKYPDEPHPDNEWAWKSFWVKKMYDPHAPFLEQDRVWVHQCWQETKARWNVR